MQSYQYTPREDLEAKIQYIRGELLRMFAPPPGSTVSRWAEEHRVLTSETSGTTGKWKNSRAPYQKEIMDAYTQRGIRKIIIMACAQDGKSEMLNNMIGRDIDEDPCAIMLVQPTTEKAEEYSKQRISSMVDACPALKKKVADAKSRSSGNTIGLKTFPGGSLTIASAQSAPSLRSKPIRKLILDEVDGYPPSVGGEGDPVKLAGKRTESYLNPVIVMASTPLIKGRSRIEKEYKLGTREEWCLPCPICGGHFFLQFHQFRYDREVYDVEGETQQRAKHIRWVCPGCGSEHKEREMRKQKGKWIARNPKALENGVRSFRLNALTSKVRKGGWKSIFMDWLESEGSPELEQVFYNTTLGEPWEQKGIKTIRPKELYERRESYTAEVPDGVLVLTMGVDVQGNRLEYEVVGWGHEEESWGIERGIIPGWPDSEDRHVWKELDGIIDRHWEREDGQKLRILVTFVDSGYRSTVVYQECKKRSHKRVYAIKGIGGEGREYVRMSGKMKKEKGIILFDLGVDEGKEFILTSLGIKETGERFCHFPKDETRGYTLEYFDGLLSEEPVLHWVAGQTVVKWERDKTSTARNEPLDLRNYARAAFKAFRIDLKSIAERLNGIKPAKKKADARGGSIRVIQEGVEV